MSSRRPDSRQTPASAAAWNDLGNALSTKAGRSEEALKCYERAIALAPRSAEAFYNRGVLLAALGRHRDALASYERALALQPSFAEAHNNRAGALAALMRHEEAVAGCTRALAIKPALTEARRNRGIALSVLGQHQEAVDDLASALESDANLPFARGTLLYSRMHCCDWRDHQESVAKIVADIRSGKRTIAPFAFLGISDSPQDQLFCSQIWVRDQCPPTIDSRRTFAPRAHQRIRLAYVSSDFRDHALGHLMAGLFERHDRSQFEVIGVSLGVNDGSTMRARLERAFDRFIDVRDMGDRQVAQLLVEMEVDIAVDCNGYTTGARPGIFGLRPAPIQVNYLGFPGTMAADYIDYIIADEVVIPRSEQASYAEKIVYLPNSYQVNDSTRASAEQSPSREEAGLPSSGFVFCSFNNSYKITPTMFDVWMRLLHRVDGSVLWLLEGNASAYRNLHCEAEKRGIAPDRLVFAPKVANAKHLARHRLAQLFLDTLPYNAHTTASDALWMGVPVLTCQGTTFAGRVAASLLHAIGMPELITHTLAEYEALAIRLAGEPQELERLRLGLDTHRESWPLFDTDRFRRAIESAYAQMWSRHQRGELPDDFSIDGRANSSAPAVA